MLGNTWSGKGRRNRKEWKEREDDGNQTEFFFHCSLMYDLMLGRGCQKLLICGSLSLSSPRPQLPDYYDDDDDGDDIRQSH